MPTLSLIHIYVPTFPAVSMDVAFVVDEAVTCEKIMQCMTSAGGKLLEDARLFDVYRDEERVGAGKKSMAFALTYRAPDRDVYKRQVEISYNGMTVFATVNDCGNMGGGSRALDLQPGVWKAFGFSSCNAWGLRTVSYRFL